MEITCKECKAQFRANLQLPLTQPVRVACPSCGKQMVLRPSPPPPPLAAVPSVATPPERPASPAHRRHAVIADEPREFRNFLGRELEGAGFEVSYFDTGDAALARVRETRAELVILNVYLKGKLGVEISEEIKGDPDLKRSKVVLIGALFRANRFRANPTNLYGADEYIEEQIPSKELQQMVRKLFPAVRDSAAEPEPQPREFDEARRLARLILSDIVIYNSDKVEQGIREGTFFEVLKSEIEDGRQYYESRVPFKVRQKTEFFHETLQQFVQMKREELEKFRSGGRA
ncbi:MAG TPA: response regulator [Thermoanaerobaculia bacterium]|nr:response regulator [Thermoanaerobaculia bacterium]